MLQKLRNDSTERLIAETVDGLADLLQRDDASSWDKAGFYLRAYGQLREEPEFVDKRGRALSKAINRGLMRNAMGRKKLMPSLSWMSHALGIDALWSELFAVNHKRLLPYDSYMRMAGCSLPREDKERLRADVEREPLSQAELKELIRRLTDAYNGIHRPDFTLKVGNFWKFDSPHENGDYGGIHPEVVANLLFWFTEPGDTVIDPMAGSGVLADTLTKYRFFREAYEAEGSGPRVGLMSDVDPIRADILEADAAAGLPFAAGMAQLAILDPPYLRVADGKGYRNLGETLEEWLSTLERIIANVIPCLAPNGAIAVITDDVLRKNEHVPIAFRIAEIISATRLVPCATIYNHNPNYVYSMGPAQMKAARVARLLCNGCKVIQVARNTAEIRA